MSSVVTPMTAMTFFGTKRAWGTSSAQDTDELLEIAAEMGKQPPLKRARYSKPEPGYHPDLMNIWSTRLLTEEIRREVFVVDKTGKLVKPHDIALATESEAQRQRLMYGGLPQPAIVPDDAVPHRTWSFGHRTKGIIHLKVARQAKGRFPKQYVLFSVKRETLVKELEFFSNMLEDDMEIAEKLSFSDDGDKTPTITIDNDNETPEDWELMCQVLFRPEHFKSMTPHWDDIGRLLEFSRKYNCFSLRAAAVHFLSTVFPTTLKGYKQRYSEELDNKVVGRPIFWPAEALFRFAIPYSLYELLPMIRFEVAATYSIEELLLGWPKNSGRPAIQVPDDELERLLKGRETLTHMRRVHTLAPLMNISRVHPINSSCTHKNEGYSCHHALALFADKLLKNENVWGPKYALHALDGRITKLLRSFVCTHCFSGLKKALAQAEREAWKMIPTIFGMGTWFDVDMRADHAKRTFYEWWLTKEKDGIEAVRRERSMPNPTLDELKTAEYWESMNEMNTEFREGTLHLLGAVIESEHHALLELDTVMGPQTVLAPANGLPHPQAVVDWPVQYANAFVTGLITPNNPNVVFVGTTQIDQEGEDEEEVANDVQEALAAGVLGNVENAGGQGVAGNNDVANNGFMVVDEPEGGDVEGWAGGEGNEGVAGANE